MRWDVCFRLKLFSNLEKRFLTVNSGIYTNKNYFFIFWVYVWKPRIRGTIQPGLRLVPSGIFFLAWNISHHYLLKKSEFNKATWAQWFNFDNFTLLKNTEIRYKVIKFESLGSSCILNSDFFNKKLWLLFKAKKKFPDDASLRPGWIVPLISSHPCFNDFTWTTTI